MTSRFLYWRLYVQLRKKFSEPICWRYVTISQKIFLGICLEFCIDDEELMLPTVICYASDKG